MENSTLLAGVLLGGGASVLATQLLKSRLIPVGFEHYPRSTAAMVSLVASIITEWQANVTISFHNLSSLGVVFVGTLWVAVSVYNHLLNS